MTKLCALVSPQGDKVFFFRGADYYRYDVAADAVDPDYPRPIADWWPGLWTADIDAALTWSDGSVFFFKGAEYVRYDWEADRVADGYPMPITDFWGSIFPSGIDAALASPSGRYYFFRGDSYLRLDPADGGASATATPIAGNWPGLWASGIESALVWPPSGKAFFFAGDQYIRYDLDADRAEAGYPLPIGGNWPGLPYTAPAAPVTPVPTATSGKPARAMTTAEAFAELDQLMTDGEILHARSAVVAGRVDLDGLVPFAGEKQDGNVAGVVIRYLSTGSRLQGAPTSGNAPDCLDPRHALAMVRLCRFLHDQWGATELYHLGAGGDTSGQRKDCHGEGRAMDFVGARGVKDGQEYVITVKDDWGTADTPLTPGGRWPTGAQVSFRLDNAPGHEFARSFFASVYAFVASEWQDRSSGPDAATTPTTPGQRSFVMNPDHPTSAPGQKNGREAHADHLHMQIGVTGSAG